MFHLLSLRTTRRCRRDNACILRWLGSKLQKCRSHYTQRGLHVQVKGSREWELQSPNNPQRTPRCPIPRPRNVKCTHAGNDGEKLIAREKPHGHSDPVSSDFKVTERSRRVWWWLVLRGIFVSIRIYTFNSLLADKLLDASGRVYGPESWEMCSGKREHTLEG